MLQKIDQFPAAAGSDDIKPLSEKPYIHPTAVIQNSRVGSWTEIGRFSIIIDTDFDDYSYADGDVSVIYSTIGKFCSIASHVRINPGNHPMDRVTQHHITYRRQQFGFGPNDEEFFTWRKKHHCVVGHDVWLGHASVVLPGVKIGTGAVIGAGSVVTKDVAPYEIAAGVPAKPIRMRFDEKTGECLLKAEWGDWDRPTLEARFDELMDVRGFVEKHG